MLILVKQSVTRCGHLLASLVRSEQLPTVSHTRSFDRVRRFFRSSLLECLRIEKSMAECMIEVQTHFLCFDQISYRNCFGMSRARCPEWGLLHNRNIHCHNDWCEFSCLTCQLHFLGLLAPMQYLLPMMLLVLVYQCTSDLDPLRRVRRDRDRFWMFQE